jgi:hypothetical protein
MVINANMARKSGKKEKKRKNIICTVVDDVGVVLTWSVRISKHGKCGYAKLKIAIKWGKIRRNRGWLCPKKEI